MAASENVFYHPFNSNMIVFEGIGFLLGLSIASLFNKSLPMILISQASKTRTSVKLCLMRLGALPFLVILIVFCFWFGVTGLLQAFTGFCQSS